MDAEPHWAPAGAASSRQSETESLARHLRATLVLGLPLVGAQLAQMAIHVTDTVLVARLGATELAAVVLATQVFYLVWIFGNGFAQATMPLAAAAEGRGDPTSLRRSIRMGLWAVTLYSALVMLPLWHLETILVWLRQPPEVAVLAGHFMRIVQWSMFPALFLANIRSCLAVVGRAQVVLAITVGTAVLNAVFAYVLIFGHLGLPALGLTGAAIASLGTNFAGAAAAWIYSARAGRLQPYRLYQRLWRPDWPGFFEVIRLGWPIALTTVAEAGLFAASSVMMGWLGATALAAHGIALQLASIAFMVPLGLAQAATVRIGLAFGRADWIGLGRAGHAALGIAILFSLVGATLFWMMPGTLIGLYLDGSAPGAPEVLATAVPLLAVAAAFQLLDGTQVVSSGLLRGLKDTRMPMLIALFSYWCVGMPIAYGLAFPVGLGGVGIWSGLAAGLFAAAILMTWRFASRTRLGLTPA